RCQLRATLRWIRCAWPFRSASEGIRSSSSSSYRSSPRLALAGRRSQRRPRESHHGLLGLHYRRCVKVMTPEQLGPYKIDAPIGAGGMGQVFRATDTRLHRTVAIKILPYDKVADPERKRRFLQEARAASALNHPNIVTLHDIASDGSIDY